MAKEATMTSKGGHLYIQTNEIENAIIHYQRGANGMLTELERVRTGGAGSGVFKPISGQDSAPNAFEGASSIVITPDRRFLFTTNGGDNSVSSFSVAEDGRVRPLDVKSTGNAVEGRSGTAKSVAYRPSTKTLYVLHSFGPDHVRVMSVGADGKLTLRPRFSPRPARFFSTRVGPLSHSRSPIPATGRSRSAATITSPKPMRRSTSIARRRSVIASTFPPARPCALNPGKCARCRSSLMPAHVSFTASGARSWGLLHDRVQALQF